jgi:hypothetical protein
MGGLSIDEQRPREGEDKIAAFIDRHGTSRHANACSAVPLTGRPERFAPAPIGNRGWSCSCRETESCTAHRFG